MKNIINVLLILPAVLPVLCSCGGRSQDAVSAPRQFPSATVPGVITDRAEAAEYMAEHFWDEFTDTSSVFACDSALVNGVRQGDLEQAFSDYAGILEMVDLKQAEASVKRLYERIESFERRDTSTNVFEAVAALAERYLYDPNSPLRNEDFYLPFVEGLSGYEGFSEVERAVYGYTVQMCSLNRTGEKAADFEFSDKNGNIRSLYGIEAGYTLLFFSNPGCEACKSIINALESDPAVDRLISEKKLAVANIYIDEDIASWYSCMPIYPDNWYNGYDPNLIIRTDLLYNVRAIPSLYLLDCDKRVIMKDAPEPRVLSYIASLAAE